MASRVKAPELSAATDWLNVSIPLSLEMLRGKIVVLDFWTFCCVDCMHILPYLKQLEHKYGDLLVVIGIHSAKFPNEKDSSQIRKAIARYDIEHPVANDARFAIWEAYWVREWPTLVLIDPDGQIVQQIPCSKNPNGKLDPLIDALIEEFDSAGKLDRSKPTFSWGTDRALGKTDSSTELPTLSYPGKITAAGGNLFIADTGHNRILVADQQGQITAVIGSGKRGRADGQFSDASFNSPQGLAEKDNFLYVADTENHLIRKVDLLKQEVSTIAGTGKQALLSNNAIKGGPALSTDLSSPWDLVWLGDQLYICMAGPHQIWYYDPRSKYLGVHAGNAVESLKDGPLAQANLAQPSGITTDGKVLYFADAETSAIRRADISGSAPAVKTLVGEGLFEFGDIDGEASKARLQHPLGIVWQDGTLYVCDSYNHKIKSVDPQTGQVTSLAGGPGAGCHDGTEARFAEPGGLTCVNGLLYVADTNNNAIRIVSPATGDTRTLPLRPAQTTIATAADPTVLPNCRKIAMPSQNVPAGEALNLEFRIELPHGFHLNNEAPSLVEAHCPLFKDQGAAHSSAKLTSALCLKTPPLSPGTTTLEAVAQIYYCGDEANSACRIASFIWTCPLEVSTKGPGAHTHIELTAKVD